MSELSFELVLKSKPVKLRNSEGVDESWVLQEVTGDQRDAYLNAMANRVRYVDGKPQGLKDFKGLQADLLTRSLLGPDGKYVNPKQLGAWPSSVVNALFKEAVALSQLEDPKTDDDSGN